MLGSVQISPRVLVVEDDPALRDVLARALREEDFLVTTAADGRSALRVTEQPDVLVVDIGLPDSDGRDVCAALRARGVQSPVLFLTARSGLHERLSGFAAGGDDYLTKPFHVSELVARLRALLRRAVPVTADLEGLVLDPASHALISPDGEIALTPTEFRLLACLMRASGGVVRRRELVAAGWPAGAYVAENTLDQYVAKLRRKLVSAKSARQLTTVRGVGYRLT
jgi:two-component system response regulator MprA